MCKHLIGVIRCEGTAQFITEDYIPIVTRYETSNEFFKFCPRCGIQLNKIVNHYRKRRRQIIDLKISLDNLCSNDMYDGHKIHDAIERIEVNIYK